MKKDSVREKIQALNKKYHYTDLYDLSEKLNIHVQEWDFSKTVRSIYKINRRQKYIMISKHLQHHEKTPALAHALGNALYHSDPFVVDRTKTSYTHKTLMEEKIDDFAQELLKSVNEKSQPYSYKGCCDFEIKTFQLEGIGLAINI